VQRAGPGSESVNVRSFDHAQCTILVMLGLGTRRSPRVLHPIHLERRGEWHWLLPRSHLESNWALRAESRSSRPPDLEARCRSHPFDTLWRPFPGL